MEKFLSVLTEKAVDIGLKLLFALIVVFIGLKLSKKVSKMILKLKCLEKADTSVVHFTSSAVKIVLYTLVFISAAMIIGVPGATLITVLGSAGLAVGLALQGSLTNLAGSIMILLFKPYKIGDVIEFNGNRGTVEDINLFYTVIATADNKVITVPNGTLSNGTIVNFSSKKIRRVDIPFSVSYRSDSERVREVILNCAAMDERVLKTPEPVVQMTGHNDNALEMTVKLWCSGDDYYGVYFDTLETVKKAFDECNIEIPYNQLDIHLRK